MRAPEPGCREPERSRPPSPSISATASFSAISTDVEAIREDVESGATGLSGAITGPAGLDTGPVEVFASIGTELLLATVVLVAVLLVPVSRSSFL